MYLALFSLLLSSEDNYVTHTAVCVYVAEKESEFVETIWDVESPTGQITQQTDTHIIIKNPKPFIFVIFMARLINTGTVLLL